MSSAEAALIVIPSTLISDIGPALVGKAVTDRLSLEAFSQLSGNIAGYPFVKLVVDRANSQIHFLNHSKYAFHSDYIAEQLLGIRAEQMDRDIDAFNYKVYMDPERRFCLGVLALHRREDRRFFSLETVEVDTMDEGLIRFFHQFVKERIDQSLPLLFKPANHHQEAAIIKIDSQEVPRIFSHELFASAQFVALNNGISRGRLRAFANEGEYRANKSTLEWYDIIAMPRVPDDIPRISGIINADHTTPLSHTNVLASGWQVPNCIQIGVLDRIQKENLNNQWIEYSVVSESTEAGLVRIVRPKEADQTPSWRTTKIHLEEPQTANVPILLLENLRASDRTKYGTKAANLGELFHVLARGSERLVGFYKIRRPPRNNLLPYLATALDVPETANLSQASWDFLRGFVKLPRGIAIPFAMQQRFLESAPKVQQAIGKLKMALELNARQVDSLCIDLQGKIMAARFPSDLRDEIDASIAENMGGVSTFVIRSSSNAEDLENFSAAGIYESINHVTSADKLFESMKQVWASIVSPRSVRLRQEVGISLDDTYMGVIVQEQLPALLGGVLVTSNPANRADFRNVYFNISPRSAVNVVQGLELPYQYLYNTVEGGGRTLSLGEAREDLGDATKGQLQRLALAGRLLQSHFSPDYTFSAPVDIEWLINDEGVHILQLRPYAK